MIMESMQETTYAEVLLPLPLPGTFCYEIPAAIRQEVVPGKRVEVQFGRNKVYAALVWSVHREKPGFSPKSVISVIDDEPVVNGNQFLFWDWVSRYYLCTPGEVMHVALPAALKLSSESRISLHPLFTGETSLVTDREYLVLEALEMRNDLTMQDVALILGMKKFMPVIRSMVEKQIIQVVEDLQEKFVPKRENMIRLAEPYEDEARLHELFSRLEKRSEKQLRLLMTFLHMTRSGKTDALVQANLLREAGVDHGVLKAMVRKEIFVQSTVIVSRLGEAVRESSPSEILFNPFQELAHTQLLHLFQQKEVVLLHGVTSSGKTEIYIRLIHETISSGKQVLYLLPEIALTTQIINRLRKYFGAAVGVYHSRYNDQERVEIWNQVRQFKTGKGDSTYAVVLGARSAMFLPFTRLGLIIVDEEHDSSYKQHEPAPRYQARDAAVILGKIHGANVLLGSATPSLESYSNAVQEKYGLVRLTERYGGLALPKVTVVDMKAETYRKRVHSHYSQVLLDHVAEALANQEQVILFQNRRGFSLRIVCESCQYTPECRNCDVTLTYHKHRHELRCHYCGFAQTPMTRCPQCGGANMRLSGFGTEKVEEELAFFFPDARIVRMDLDSTRSRYAYQRILADFESRKTDILVGTQMVTKGLDFEHVNLVGVLNADNQWSYPDFRAFERSYQLLAQVSGRSGRKFRQGSVVIQTWNPNHPILNWVAGNRYEEMAAEQLKERMQFKYPPYYRLIHISLKHKDQLVLNRASQDLATALRQVFGKRVAGPEYPLVSRVNQLYIKQILVKIERETSQSLAKEKLMEQVRRIEKNPDYRPLRTIVDVDPY